MGMNLEKDWATPDRMPHEISSRLGDYPELFKQILFNRGIDNLQSAKEFLTADYNVYDPFLLQDMAKAVEIIQAAVQKREVIVVFGDYDVDGVTATALLIQVLWKLGANAIQFIPNRFEHGYGFSFEALEKVLALNPALIITVDCGVRSNKVIESVEKLGVSVIVTDHHQPGVELPPADAVLCPRIPGNKYPNVELAGVGIAFKLAQALLDVSPQVDFDVENQLDLVALGTIADLARLTPENRALVKKGLDIIHCGRRDGIVALAEVSGLDYKKIKAEHIGFMLGPRLNAAGRLSSAESAFQLLIAKGRESAAPLALMLDQENRARQEITREIQCRTEEWIANQGQEWLLFHSSQDFNEGVIGLAASRLVESYYRPVIIGTVKNDMIRASCRSIPEINITEALDECADLLVQHGGHAMAAGLSILVAHQEEFYRKLSGIIRGRLSGRELKPVIQAECETSLLNLEPRLIRYLESLEPTGIGNPHPLFITRGVQLRYLKTVGADNSHLKISVQSGKEENGKRRGSITFDAIAFRIGHMMNQLSQGDLVDILYSYEKNVFNGREYLQLNVQDIKPDR